MRLLDRYLLRELLIPLAGCLSGFLIFYVGFDLFNELPRLQASQLSVLEMGEYYLYKLPELLSFVIVPVSLLLALLYTLTGLARHNELTAMRAAGISLMRLCAPFFSVGLFISVGMLLLNEVIAPNSSLAAQEVLNRHAKEKPDAAAKQWQTLLNFSNEGAGRLWSIGRYNLETAEMINPNVEWRPADKTIRRLFAKRGALTNGVWTFYTVQLLVYRPPEYDLPKPEYLTELAVPEFNETPALIRSEIKVASMDLARAAKRIRFTLPEIMDYRRLHPNLSGEKYSMLHTQLHGRLAQPWTAMVVVLIAIPFGALTGRRNVFVGVASSIFICFAYFVVAQLGLSLGTGGKLPPWLAAWLPNLLFGAGGLWFILKAR